MEGLLACVTTLLCLLVAVLPPLQDIEEALIKRDVKRQKLQEAKNVPDLVARVNEMNSTALRRRTKMMLPAPQVRGAHAGHKGQEGGMLLTLQSVFCGC